MSEIDYSQIPHWSNIPRAIVVASSGLMNADRESFINEMVEQSVYLNALQAMQSSFGSLMREVLHEMNCDSEKIYFRLMAFWLKKTDINEHLSEFRALVASFKDEILPQDYALFSKFMAELLKKIAKAQFILDDGKALKKQEINFFLQIMAVLE